MGSCHIMFTKTTTIILVTLGCTNLLHKDTRACKCIVSKVWFLKYLISSYNNNRIVYVYHLQEMGYTQFIGCNTSHMYWRREDGQIYNKKNKYYIRCGYSRMILYPHLIRCPNWMPPHQFCGVGEYGAHRHPLPTREELTDQLLRWKIKITQYKNPKWNNEKVAYDRSPHGWKSGT